MADYQTDIRITASNETAQPVREARAGFEGFGKAAVTALTELRATAEALASPLKSLASISKEVRLSIQDIGKTTREVAGYFNEGAKASRELAKSGREVGQGLEQGGERGKKAATALGAALRAALEVATVIGPKATKEIAGVSASALDMGAKLHRAGKDGEKGMGGFTEGVHKAGDAIDSIKKKIDETRKKIGLGLIAGGVAGEYALSRTVAPAATKETQIASISALTKSDARARAIYGQADELSTDSAFNLPDLVSASKTLASQRLFSKRYLTASDDAAAVRPEEFKPDDIARALTRLSVGDTGEALERFRDIGISRKDIESKGVKFDGNGALSDTSQAGIDKAMEAVVSSIEEKFGGLSKRLATSTFEGAVSNLEDATGRFKTSIGEAFIPALTAAAKAITWAVGVVNSIPEPVKQAIAWVAALVFGIGILGGVFLIIAKTVGTIIFVFKAFNFVAGLLGISTGGLVQSITGLAGTMVTRFAPAVATVAGAISTAVLAIGAILAGLAIGGTLYNYVVNPIQKALGDKMAPSGFAEAAHNVYARATGWFTGAEVTEEDGLTASEKRAKAQEAAAQRADAAARAASATPPSAPMAAPSTPSFDSADAAQAEIERLQDAIRATDDAEEKKRLTLQLFYAQRAARHQRQDAAAVKREEMEQKKQAREAEALRKRQLRETGFASGADAAEFGADADERIAGLRSGEEIGELRDRRSLNAQIRATKASDLTKSAKSDRISALRDLYAARDAARKADIEAQVSELEAQKALAEGASTASGQEGPQRAATLRKAAAVAQRLREIGVLKSRAEREEADESAKEAQQRLDAANQAAGGKNGLAALFAAGRLKGSYNRSSAQGGRMFSPGMGSFAGSFIGSQEDRLRDAAQSASAFNRIGANQYGEKREKPQLQALVRNEIVDIFGNAQVLVELLLKQQAPSISQGLRAP